MIREHVRGGVECQSRVQLRGYTSVRGTERLLTPLYFIFASKNGTCCFTCEGTIRRNGGVRLDRQLVWSFLWWHLELSSVSSSAGARSRVMPPHRPREDGLAHPTDTSRAKAGENGVGHTHLRGEEQCGVQDHSEHGDSCRVITLAQCLLCRLNQRRLRAPLRRQPEGLGKVLCPPDWLSTTQRPTG